MADPVEVVVPFPPRPASPAPREIEIKLDVAGTDLPSLVQAMDALGGPKRLRRLRSVYWDTDDAVLSRAGIGLRIRHVGRDRIQTVKADDGGLFDRSEWETPAGEVPDLDAAPPLRPALAGAGPVRPQFENRVERREQLVEWGGARIELALDIGEVEALGRRAPIAQLELELKGGAPEALFGLARELSRQAPLRLTFETKAGQGYRLAAGEPVQATKARRPSLDRDMTVVDALSASAGAALVQVVANERVVRQFRRPEGVHQMRVGLRRLRTALSLYRPPGDDPAYSALRAELKWLADQLGPARDLDVFIAETFAPTAEALRGQSGVAAFGKRLKRAQTRAYDRLVKALDSRRAMAIPLEAAAWLEAGAWRADPGLAGWRDAPIRPFAEAALDRLRRKVKRRRRAETPEALHDLRLAAKALRYGLDGFGGLFPAKASAAYGRRVAEAQGLLGGLNDLAVGSRVAVDALGAASPPETVFAAGLIVGRRTSGQPELEDRAARAVKTLLAARPPWRGRT